MSYYEFVTRLGQLIGLEPGTVEHWGFDHPTPSLAGSVELFWHGLHEGRYMRISRVVRDTDAPELFAAVRAQV